MIWVFIGEAGCPKGAALAEQTEGLRVAGWTLKADGLS